MYGVNPTNVKSFLPLTSHFLNGQFWAKNLEAPYCARSFNNLWLEHHMLVNMGFGGLEFKCHL
jgi:hypothetical protein